VAALFSAKKKGIAVPIPDVLIIAVTPGLLGTSDTEFEATNVIGCQRLVRHALAASVARIVYVSSIACVDHFISHDGASERDPQPTAYAAPYDRTKRAFEDWVLALHAPPPAPASPESSVVAVAPVPADDAQTRGELATVAIRLGGLYDGRRDQYWHRRCWPFVPYTPQPVIDSNHVANAARALAVVAEALVDRPWEVCAHADDISLLFSSCVIGVLESLTKATALLRDYRSSHCHPFHRSGDGFTTTPRASTPRRTWRCFNCAFHFQPLRVLPGSLSTTSSGVLTLNTRDGHVFRSTRYGCWRLELPAWAFRALVLPLLGLTRLRHRGFYNYASLSAMSLVGQTFDNSLFTSTFGFQYALAVADSASVGAACSAAARESALPGPKQRAERGADSLMRGMLLFVALVVTGNCSWHWGEGGGFLFALLTFMGAGQL